MLLEILWVIAVWAAIGVFFVFYLAFAYLLFSPLFDYLIARLLKWGFEGVVSRPIGSRYLSGRTRAWLKSKNPDFQRS